jgi:Arc/MetJ-type ribon-helix-helix transcriptional regulator
MVVLLNVNVGVPYEAIMQKVIERGYAGNQTEVIRQALLAYERMLEEEEVELVNKGIEFEMQEMKAGRIKTKGFEQIKKKFKW